ncbi:uncharacterized protein TrAFT101_008153 [Trichoderma asperellum]|uniref:Major facilitator superfamily (MFS) profile domain-containing protein n=1 Tax=Trichoderma asperellum (strain ATCC 204424 / CBS 433.97 / NBRC 101777) TaxID=1042311 RepID=A0A2T3YQQ0_TRIA4|nr:hypothetical protein M441DRAFT_63127 [Trichoderma asperellum CBS 433.97]PTB34895.1 hypothetical protein M441DRAFT_63127 [Trichoderma asperellum CBS 433.97]UKZ93232.1 hypothetical protein TrAFT101_008153 [Trichoderma asperellum]
MPDMENPDSDRPLEDVDATPLLGDRSSRGFQSLFTRQIPTASLLLYVCLFLVMELGGSLPANSLVQVVEEALCREMRGAPDCGADDDVQSSLAILMGWYHTAMILPGLLTVLPYGMLADRYGQKPFLVLSTFGIALTGACVRIICFWPEKFSIHALWATQLLYFIGGGLPVSNAIVFANITSLTTDVSRSSVFSFIIALSLGPRLIATIVASRLIELYGPWLPLWFSLGFLVATCLLSFFIIEPKKKVKHLDDSVSDDANAYSSSEQPTAAAGSRQLKDKILRSFQEARAGASFLMQKSSSFTIRIIVCLIFMTLAWQCSGVSEQLMRRRFGWSWAKLSYVTALQIIVGIISCMIILPIASYIMSSKFTMSATARDLSVARACGAVFIFGAIITTLTPNGFGMLIGVVLFNLGTVYNQVLKSLLVVVVGENSVVLFSGLNILETIGNLTSAPLVAQAFKFGLWLGGIWMALPVMFSGSFALIGLLVLGVKNSN